MAKQLGALRFKGKLANVVGYKNTSGANTTNPNYVRERVYEISNPQTYAQSTQRSKMKPAQLFYAAFEPVLNHAFLPSAKASRNRNRFMSLALRNGVPGVERGETNIPVMSYQISEGSLGLDRYTVGTPGDVSVTFPLVDNDAAGSVGEYSQAIIANNVGIVAGMELTFLMVGAINGDFNARFASHFSIVLNPTDNINDLATLIPAGFALESDGGNVMISAAGDVTLLAAGLIISSKTTGSYIYTNSSMVITEAGQGYRLSDLITISSYMKGAGSHSSELILQQATNAQAGNLVVPVSYENMEVGDPATNIAAVTMSDGTRRLIAIDNAGTLGVLNASSVVVSAGVTAAELGEPGAPTIALADVQRYLDVAYSAGRAIQKVSWENGAGNEVIISEGANAELSGGQNVSIYVPANKVSLVSVTMAGQSISIGEWADGKVQCYLPDASGSVSISDDFGPYCSIVIEARP